MQKTALITLAILFNVCALSAQELSKEIPLSGNAYVTKYPEGASITQEGLTHWTDSRSVINTYVYFSRSQTINVQLKGDAPEKSAFSVGFLDKTRTFEAPRGKLNTAIGTFQVPQAGYYAFSLQGLPETGARFPDITSFVIQSSDTAMAYVHNFSDYWGRRGPSVHLSYPMPEDTIEWFYNEVTVPDGNDIIGSYYMANGFGEGYFGMQCNSENERRVLFSVWSPFDTQDPKLIPDSLKIKLLRRGEGVHIGEFGNEGSGGQSFLRYHWKAGNTYRFLTQIHPDGKGQTVYTAYFFAADENRWQLIASFLRPETNVHYTRAHSFLENFIPGQGYITRRVFFGNQWFRTQKGEWVEATQARFTYDATAKAGVRLDYQGGYESGHNQFFLRNCGFFHESTTLGDVFTRNPENNTPNIDFDALEKL